MISCFTAFNTELQSMIQVLTAKLVQVGSNMPSSPDSSSDSSTGSPQHPYEGPNVEAENCLPGVVSITFKGYWGGLVPLGSAMLHIP